MFNKGEKIIYGQTGVCIVEDVAEKMLSRNLKKLYYTLRPVYQNNNVIYTPVDNEKVFMRRVISKNEAENLIENIPEIKEKVLSEDKMIPEDFKADFESHSCEDLAEIAIKIYAKKQTARRLKRKLGFIDEKYLKRAEELLFGELATVLDMPIDEMPHVVFGNM